MKKRTRTFYWFIEVEHNDNEEDNLEHGGRSPPCVAAENIQQPVHHYINDHDVAQHEAVVATTRDVEVAARREEAVEVADRREEAVLAVLTSRLKLRRRRLKF